MKLLVAIDASEHARAAVDEVRRLTWPADTSVTLLSVVRTDLYAFGDFYAPAAHQIGVLVEEERKRAQALLEGIAAELAPRGLAVTTRVVVGDPRSVVCEVARESAADWLVVGSHGRRGFQKLLLGSVASHVVTHAQCSVLVVKKSPPES